MKREWTICWLSLAAAIVFTGADKWCCIRAAQSFANGQAAPAAARTTAAGYLLTGYAFAFAGIVAAVVGCVAWWLSVRKKEAGIPLVPIILLAFYLLLSLLLV